MVFLGDIAFILDMALLVAGLIVLYLAKKEDSKLLKITAWIMIVTGVLAVICTSYYWLYYYQNDVFEMHNIMSFDKS